jgi:hypothetical protein
MSPHLGVLVRQCSGCMLSLLAGHMSWLDNPGLLHHYWLPSCQVARSAECINSFGPAGLNAFRTRWHRHLIRSPPSSSDSAQNRSSVPERFLSHLWGRKFRRVPTTVVSPWVVIAKFMPDNSKHGPGSFNHMSLKSEHCEMRPDVAGSRIHVPHFRVDH